MATPIRPRTATTQRARTAHPFTTTNPAPKVPRATATPPRAHQAKRPGWGARFNTAFNAGFNRFLDWFDGIQKITLARPLLTVLVILGSFVVSLILMPFIGLAYFPRTDPGQFVVTVKAPTGTRVEMTEGRDRQGGKSDPPHRAQG